jgi:hypothetical protein
MRCPYKNEDYRKHWSAHRRALVAPQHSYDKRDPIGAPQHLLDRVKLPGTLSYYDVARYAAALGRKRGELPDNLSSHHATVLPREEGTALVLFTPVEYVVTGTGYRYDPTGPVVSIEVRHLDWVPAAPIQEVDE